MFCFSLCYSVCFHILASVTGTSSCWPCSFSCSCPCLLLHPFCFINLSCSFHSRCCTQILFDVLKIVNMVIIVAIRPRFGKMMEVRGLRIPFASPISVRLHVPVLVPVLFTCSCSHLYSRFVFILTLAFSDHCSCPLSMSPRLFLLLSSSISPVVGCPFHVRRDLSGGKPRGGERREEVEMR